MILNSGIFPNFLVPWQPSVTLLRTGKFPKQASEISQAADATNRLPHSIAALGISLPILVP